MTKPGAPPAFQCYAADHLADAATMSAEHFGHHWRLTLIAWREGGLPREPERIAGLLGLTPKALARVWVVIGHRWRDDGQRLVLDWQEDQRAGRKHVSAARSAAARARWGPPREQPTCTDDANAYANAAANGAAQAPALHSIGTALPSISHQGSHGVRTSAAAAYAGAGERARVEAERWAQLDADPLVQQLLAKMETDVDRQGIQQLLVRVPYGPAWAADLVVQLNGEARGAASRPTPAEVAAAARAFLANGECEDGKKPTLLYFGVYLRKAREGVLPTPPSANGRAQPKPQQQPYDASANAAAASRLAREAGDDGDTPAL